jgi:hypothetical protein
MTRGFGEDAAPRRSGLGSSSAAAFGRRFNTKRDTTVQFLRHAFRVALVFGSWFGLAATTAAQAEEPVSIAILPIVVHSADDPTFLRNGLADMLASRIEQAGGFEVVRVEEVELGTTRLPQAIDTAKERGTDFVLFGSFTRFGTGASLDMQCASTRPDFEADPLREIFVHTGSIGEVIPDLDALIGKVGRFAIPGFGQRPDVAAAPPTEADTAQTLEARVQALEKLVAELQATGAVGPAQP